MDKTNLKILAEHVANGAPYWPTRASLFRVNVKDGQDLVVRGNDMEWRGSVAEWQSALLAALSAKLVEGTLVIVAPETASPEQMLQSVKMARERIPNPIVMLRHDWQAMSRDEMLRALDSTEHYPQLTDWVRAQPSGAALLVVFGNNEDYPMIPERESDGYTMHITEASLAKAIKSDTNWSAVWISRHVSPECEAKIPRGVKVYRER